MDTVDKHTYKIFKTKKLNEQKKEKEKVKPRTNQKQNDDAD